MSDFQVSDYTLQKECDELAAEIFREVMDEAEVDEDAEFHRDTMFDRAHETADGHNWVIYNHKALMICAHCNTNAGEDFLKDVGMPEQVDIYSIATATAYGEMRSRIEQELERLIEEYETEEA